MPKRITIVLCCLLAAAAVAQNAVKSPKLLPWSQQLSVREQWLVKRHEMILPMMRAHQIDMWIVVNEEFHDDPLTQYIAPPRPYAGGRDYFVFIDTGEKGLRKIAITGFAEENLKHFFESPDEPRPADKVLPELYEQYKPKKIALSYGGRRGVQRSITYDTYNLIAEKMGADAAQHFVPAADLIEAGIAVFRRFAIEHPALYRIGVQRELPQPELAEKFMGEARAAMAGLRVRVERLEQVGLLGERSVRDGVIAFHALCEGLASLELRGTLPEGDEEHIWRDALTVLVRGFANASQEGVESTASRSSRDDHPPEEEP
jgi:hypothetical protein